MEEVFQYYAENNVCFIELSRKFKLNRRALTKAIKEKYPNYKVIQFVGVSNKIHNNTYDYSLVKDIVYRRDKVDIICKKHGVFSQSPKSHLRGNGCPKCGYETVKNKLTKDVEIFIKEAKEVHGNKYDYSKVVYLANNIKVDIVCKHHGLFKQIPCSHIKGHGCFLCSIENLGWSRTKWSKQAKGRPATLYVVKCYNGKEEFIKIGRTFNGVKRRLNCKSDLPYNYEELITIETKDYNYVFDLEVHLHRYCKDFKYIPNDFFDGFTECFTIDALDNIKQTINNFKNAKPT